MTQESMGIAEGAASDINKTITTITAAADEGSQSWPPFQGPVAQLRAHTLELVQQTLADLGSASVSGENADTPLMESGLDSLGATEIPSRLSLLTGIALPSTLVFEQPTGRLLADHVLELVGSSKSAVQSTADSRVPSSQPSSRADPLCLHSAKGKLPAAVETPDRLRGLLRAAGAQCQ